MSIEPTKRFHVALSFTGEKRDYVAEVAEQLASLFGQESILYDKYHEAEFARSDLSLYLPELYHKEADLVVVVICPDYEKKEWTGLEWSAIHDLIAKRRQAEVMLCRFEHASLRGLYGAGYIELDERSPIETVQLILERLALNEGHPKDFYTSRFGDPPTLAAAVQDAKAQRLREQLWASSVALDDADSFFITEVPPLARDEVTKIAAWVGEEGRKPEDRLIAVVGDAGSGKTVVLKEAARLLHAQQVPVLAFKADRVWADSLPELLAKLPPPLRDLAGVVSQLADLGMPKLVVFIDQLDALSLSLSTKREALNAYRELITVLERLPGVRIVVSCRGYDLLADPALQKYANRHQNIELPRLSVEQVHEVVFKSPLREVTLTTTLLDLLRLPLHLRIFCQLSPQTDFLGVLTLQDLYENLFAQRVLAPVGPPTDLARLLYEVAEQMHLQQELAVSAARYATTYRVALAYALTNRLLVQPVTGRQLQFFHQSFFDYVFARQFVERGQAITDLLRPAANQGLFFRATLRQVLAYQREADFTAYWRQARTLLTEAAIYRWHLRLLTCQFLAQVAAPQPAEQDFVRSAVLVGEYRESFLEVARGKGWLGWPVLLDVTRQCLQRSPEAWTRSERAFVWQQAHENAEDALHLLAELPATADTLETSLTFLQFFRDAPNTAFAREFDRFTVLAEAQHPGSTTRLLFYRAGADPAHTAAVLRRVLRRHRVTDGGVDRSPSHDETYCLDELMKADSQTALQLCRELIEDWIEETRMDRFLEYERRSVFPIEDHAFSDAQLDKEHPYSVAGMVMRQAYLVLTDMARRDATAARAVLADWPASNYCTVLALVAATYRANPRAFAEEAVALLHRKGVVEAEDGQLRYQVVELVRALVPELHPAEQTSLWEWIGTRRFPEWRYATRENKQEAVKRGWLRSETERRRFQLWSVFPAEIWQAPPEARRHFLALQRRFTNVPNHKPGVRVRSRSGARQFARPAARCQLTAADWLAAMRQQERRPDEWWREDEPPTPITADFKVAATECPAIAVTLLEQLLLLPVGEVSGRYFLEGLQGLSENLEVDPAIVSDLLLRGVETDWAPSADYYTIRVAVKCLKRGHRGEALLDFLKLTAEVHAHDERAIVDEKGHSEPLQDGINTTGGRAVGALVRHLRKPEHAGRVEALVRYIAAHGSSAVRAATLYELDAWLNGPNSRAVVTQLFCDLIGTDYYLLAHTGDSFSWFAHLEWERLEPLLEVAIFEPRAYETLDGVLMNGWFRGRRGAPHLLRYLWTVSDVARGGTVSFLHRSYDQLTPNQRVLTRQVITELLPYGGEKTQQAFAFFFHGFPPADFPAWYPTLQQFVQSPGSYGRDRSFYEFLSTCVAEHPAECIELIAAFASHERPDIRKNDIERLPLAVLLSAYHVLVERTREAPQLERVLDVFDQLLRQADYRLGHSDDRKIIEAMDRY